MPATKTELIKVRQELNEKTPLLYQAVVFNSFQWVKGYEQYLIKPNTLTDFKIALMKEAITIWETGNYNFQNIKNVISSQGGWEGVLQDLQKVKNQKTAKFDTATIKPYIEERVGLPYIYEDYNNYITEWETITYTSNPTDFKTWWDKVIKDHWTNNFKAKYGSLGDNDGLLKIKADLDKLAKWQDAFPGKTPAEVKDLITKAEQAQTKAEGETAQYKEKLGKDKTPDQLKTEIEATKTAKETAEAELTKYKEQAGGKTPDELKTELANLNKRPNITQADYDQLLNGKNQLNQVLPGLFNKDGKLDEKKLAELQNLQNNQFKHPDDQLEKPKPDDSKISDQKKGPFLTYLHTRPVFSNLYKEIKELNSNVELLHVTDDKNEFLKNLSENRFNLLLWEWKSGSWSVLWTHYREKYAYYTDTDEELEFHQEEAQIKKFLKGESFGHSFFHYGIDNSAEGKTKQGFATAAIEAILKRIKDDPKLEISKDGSNLNLLENSADIAQKEYDVYLEQLNQKDQKVQEVSQIEVVTN